MIAIPDLRSKTLDLSSAFSPYQLRFLDCKRFLAGWLMLYETDYLPEGQYATISYPWQGISNINLFDSIFMVGDGHHSFGDAISITVLKAACNLAIMEGAHLLWLDRICICQKDPRDKIWQIHRMYNLYQKCKVCMIIPGGLQRLAYLDEETSWISRLWTLQEAIVPPKAIVIFMARVLPYAASNIAEGLQASPIKNHDDGESYASLLKILQACQAPNDGLRLFHPVLAHYLHNAMLLYRGSTTIPVIKTSKREFSQLVALWQSAMTRSAAIPEDLLLGTMDILGIPLMEGERRSDKNTILLAFTRELTKYGMLDDRGLAFKVALEHATASDLPIPQQWKDYTDHFLKSMPLIWGGIESTELHGCVAEGSVSKREGCQYFLGVALVAKEERHLIQPCTIIASKNDTFSCRLVLNRTEQTYIERWALLPFDKEQMQWVPVFWGSLRFQARLIVAGYELDSKGHKVNFYFIRTKVNGEYLLGATDLPDHLSVESDEGLGASSSDNDNPTPRSDISTVCLSFDNNC